VSVGGSNPDALDLVPPEDGGGPLAGSRRSRLVKGEGRGVLISTASTVVVLAVVVAVVLTAPGTPVIRDRFFDPTHLRQAFPAVARAFLLNIRIMLIAEAFILVFALVIAVVRSIPGPVFFPIRAVAIGYVDLFRGIPLILVLFIVGYGVPALYLRGISTHDVVTYGIVSLVLVYSAYVAEVYRAGIESVHDSQTSAARSLGLSRWKALRYVVLPQAIRRVVPPLLNDFIGLQKDTALVSVIGPVEAAREAQNYGSQTFNFAGYVVAAFLFVLCTIPLARFVDHLIARDRRRRQAGTVR
jgi:polar amino acid transport system permease protein